MSDRMSDPVSEQPADQPPEQVSESPTLWGIVKGFLNLHVEAFKHPTILHKTIPMIYGAAFTAVWNVFVVPSTLYAGVTKMFGSIGKYVAEIAIAAILVLALGVTGWLLLRQHDRLVAENAVLELQKKTGIKIEKARTTAETGAAADRNKLATASSEAVTEELRKQGALRDDVVERLASLPPPAPAADLPAVTQPVTQDPPKASDWLADGLRKPAENSTVEPGVTPQVTPDAVKTAPRSRRTRADKPRTAPSGSAPMISYAYPEPLTRPILRASTTNRADNARAPRVISRDRFEPFYRNAQ